MKNNLAYRLYGRTKGRKKKNSNFFSKIKLKKIDEEVDYIIDIGAGYGESTIKLAQANNDKIVICCEKYVDGLNSLFNKVQTHSITNIEIYQGNVHQLLDEHCKKDSISDFERSGLRLGFCRQLVVVIMTPCPLVSIAPPSMIIPGLYISKPKY